MSGDPVVSIEAKDVDARDRDSPVPLDVRKGPVTVDNDAHDTIRDAADAAQPRLSASSPGLESLDASECRHVRRVRRCRELLQPLEPSSADDFAIEIGDSGLACVREPGKVQNAAPSYKRAVNRAYARSA